MMRTSLSRVQGEERRDLSAPVFGGEPKLAEREGFEPSIPDLVQYDGLANRCFQPLSHLSGVIAPASGQNLTDLAGDGKGKKRDVRLRGDWQFDAACGSISP